MNRIVGMIALLLAAGLTASCGKPSQSTGGTKESDTESLQIIPASQEPVQAPESQTMAPEPAIEEPPAAVDPAEDPAVHQPVDPGAPIPGEEP